MWFLVLTWLVIGPKLFAPVVPLLVLATIKVSFSNVCQNRPSQAMFISVCYVSTTNIQYGLRVSTPFLQLSNCELCQRGMPAKWIISISVWIFQPCKQTTWTSNMQHDFSSKDMSHISIQDTYITYSMTLVLDTFRYGALRFPSSLGSMLDTHQRALEPGLRNGFDSILTSKFRWLWNGWSWIGLFGCEKLPRCQESTGKMLVAKLYKTWRCLQCFGEKQRREAGLSDPKKSRQMWFPASLVWTLKIPPWNKALSRYIAERLHGWCHSERGMKVEKKWQGPKLPQNENVTITNKKPPYRFTNFGHQYIYHLFA